MLIKDIAFAQLEINGASFAFDANSVWQEIVFDSASIARGIDLDSDDIIFQFSGVYKITGTVGIAYGAEGGIGIRLKGKNYGNVVGKSGILITYTGYPEARRGQIDFSFLANIDKSERYGLEMGVRTLQTLNIMPENVIGDTVTFGASIIIEYMGQL